VIAVDSGVWIDYLKGTQNPEADRLDDIIASRTALIVVGDLVLCEVLKGVGPEAQAARVERELRRFQVEAMSSPDLAVKAAANYRALRARGHTVRKTVDLLIGTFCVERGLALLHRDRDFEPMARHLGLAVVPV
jgi:predicted nucleic acid-binding protein